MEAPDQPMDVLSKYLEGLSTHDRRNIVIMGRMTKEQLSKLVAVAHTIDQLEMLEAAIELRTLTDLLVDIG